MKSVQSFCYCGRMKSVCKAFVIVENEECVQSFYCRDCGKAFVNEECVQSFCYCRD